MWWLLLLLLLLAGGSDWRKRQYIRKVYSLMVFYQLGLRRRSYLREGGDCNCRPGPTCGSVPATKTLVAGHVVLQYSHLPQTTSNRQTDDQCLHRLLYTLEMYYPQPLIASFQYVLTHFHRAPLALEKKMEKITTRVVSPRLAGTGTAEIPRREHQLMFPNVQEKPKTYSLDR